MLQKVINFERGVVPNLRAVVPGGSWHSGESGRQCRLKERGEDDGPAMSVGGSRRAVRGRNAGAES